MSFQDNYEYTETNSNWESVDEAKFSIEIKSEPNELAEVDPLTANLSYDSSVKAKTHPDTIVETPINDMELECVSILRTTFKSNFTCYADEPF